jgi:pyruvate-formate lyase
LGRRLRYRLLRFRDADRKQMQFFGARANLRRRCFNAINGGKDEISGEQIGPPSPRSQATFWIMPKSAPVWTT